MTLFHPLKNLRHEYHGKNPPVIVQSKRVNQQIWYLKSNN